MKVGDRKPPRAQAPAGSAVKPSGAASVAAPGAVRPNAPSRGVADAVTRATDFDPTDHLPAHAGLAVSSADVAKAADALDGVARSVADADASAILARAAAAARTAASLGTTGGPATVVLKEDPKRPSTLEGFVDRRTRGSGAGAHVSVLFRPRNKDIQPFPLDPASVEGLPSGALVKLKLARKERGQESFVLQAAESEFARSMVANVVVEGGKAYAVGRGILTPYAKVPIEGPASQLAGSAVVVDIHDGGSASRSASVREVLGKEDGAKASFFQIATEAGSTLDFPPEVMAEIAAIKANPDITGTDLTSIPFVTIDYETSKDLDQAVALVKRPDGNIDVHYAIADASHFVKEGSALDREARHRGLTTYLPGGRSLPVLPPELSEDLCSLVANQKRRAFVVTVTVDPEGQPISSKFQRGVIQSRAKLAYNGVQKFHDSGFQGPLAGKDYSESLELLETFGKLRIAESIKRGVVPANESKLEIRATDAAATKFEIGKSARNEVEKWNEQVSLLVNEQVGKFLVDSGARVLHRVHMPPDPAKVDAFRARVASLGVPWGANVELDDYIRGLDESDMRTATIQRWATRINKAAIYSTEPLGHSALKLGAYDHFTAPMRRYSDIVVHRVLAALIEDRPIPYQSGGELERISGRMESARRRTGDVAGRTRAYMTAAMLEPFVGQTLAGRILDVSPSAVTVALKSPQVEVEIPVTALNQAVHGGSHALTRGGIAVEGPTGAYEVGKSIDVVVTVADPAGERVVAMPAGLDDVLPKAA